MWTASSRQISLSWREADGVIVVGCKQGFTMKQDLQHCVQDYVSGGFSRLCAAMYIKCGIESTSDAVGIGIQRANSKKNPSSKRS